MGLAGNSVTCFYILLNYFKQSPLPFNITKTILNFFLTKCQTPLSSWQKNIKKHNVCFAQHSFFCTFAENNSTKGKIMKTNITRHFKTAVLALMALIATGNASAQEQQTDRTEIMLETTLGNIRLALYNETPLHSKNFKELVERGFYDGILFHRVISKFMIQAGDSTSRNAAPGTMLGEVAEPYTIPAEICYPTLMHKRGALCMAREGDEENPERASSAYQFYIVYGQRFNDEMLDKMQQRLDESTQGKVKLTDEVREVYKRVGGTPHLDGQYTVFGEVLEGIDVVRDIQWEETDKNDRPLKDMKIIKAHVVK